MPQIETLARGLSILSEFTAVGQVLSVGQLASRLNINKSSVSRMAATLVDLGYLDGTSTPGQYVLGWRMAKLGQLVSPNIDLRRAAQPVLAELARTIGETSQLGVLSGANVVTIDFAEGTHIMRMHSGVGRTFPAHLSASGLCLLAWYPGTFADLEAELLGDMSDVERSVLRRNIAQIREDGWAYDDQALEAGLRCIGAPILNAEGIAIASLSTSGPTSRINGATLPAIVDAVKSGAALVSERISSPAESLPARA